MPTIVANGLEIGYETVGAGPPLIMLHGATTSGRATFAAQIEPLSTAFLVVLPDARGHGWTRWDADDGFRAEWLIDDLFGFVDAFGLATFHLCGYSMGAMTALGFAVRAPERVRTLVVAGIAPEREPRASVTRRLMDPARILRSDPSWAAELTDTLDPSQGPGAWQRLLPAIAAGCGGPAVADRRGAAFHLGADPGHLRRPRSARPGRPGLAAGPAGP